MKRLDEYNGKIFVAERIKDENNHIRGVYGIFVQDGNGNSECVYIGRSESMYERMFIQGHITALMKGNHSNSKLNEAMKKNDKTIHVEILQEVPLVFDNYYKDAHRLAFAEYYWIYFYQGMNQCLEQLPEGKNIDLTTWENMKSKSPSD